MIPAHFYYFNSDVQFGQRVALMEIVLKQYGQSLVVGSAGAGAFFNLFAIFTMRKITKAMIRKSIMDCTKTPHVMTVIVPTGSVRSLKLTPPVTSPRLA